MTWALYSNPLVWIHLIFVHRIKALLYKFSRTLLISWCNHPEWPGRFGSKSVSREQLKRTVFGTHSVKSEVQIFLNKFIQVRWMFLAGSALRLCWNIFFDNPFRPSTMLPLRQVQLQIIHNHFPFFGTFGLWKLLESSISFWELLTKFNGFWISCNPCSHLTERCHFSPACTSCSCAFLIFGEHQSTLRVCLVQTGMRFL